MAIRFLPALLILLAVHAQAATLLEVRTPQGVTRIYHDGSLSRLGLDDRRYIIADSSAQTLFVVDPQRQQVTDMSPVLKSAAQTSPHTADVRFEKQGSGPRVAGYLTTRYRYLLDSEPCGTLLASQQALQDTGLQDAFKLLQQMAQYAADGSARASSASDACSRAADRLSAHAEKVGMPMRIEGKDGMPLSEVLRIETDTGLPQNAFKVPAGYRKQDVGRIDGAARTPGAMQEGGIPPEILRRLQQLQQTRPAPAE